MSYWFLVGVYVLGVMFFGGLMLLWTTFGWLCGTSQSPIYHVFAFFVSVALAGFYEYYALVFLGWIAEKLDI